jgi:hypothetical protein
MASIHQRDARKLPLLTDSFWTESWFAWGTLLASLSLATVIYATILALGYQLFEGILAAATPMLILMSGSFLVREERRRRQARRIAASQYAEMEELLRALKRLSSDDRQEVICRVLDEYDGQYDERNDEELRMRLFGLYVLGCSSFLIAVVNGGHTILADHAPIEPLLAVALIISTLVVVEMLLRAIRALRTRPAELVLKRLLGLTL